jgi:hypothetical protein
VKPRTLLFWSMGATLLSAAWLLLLGYAGLLVGTPPQTIVEKVLFGSIVVAGGSLLVCIPVVAVAVLGSVCGGA